STPEGGCSTVDAPPRFNPYRVDNIRCVLLTQGAPPTAATLGYGLQPPSGVVCRHLASETCADTDGTSHSLSYLIRYLSRLSSGSRREITQDPRPLIRNKMRRCVSHQPIASTWKHAPKMIE